ncbi:Protein-lysine N-methyltransferase efm4 [Thecaphora frezii]
MLRSAGESLQADEGEPLPESKLGTKAHWDSVYAREVDTFEEIGEEGEVWFGEDAVMRMIRHLEKHYTDEAVVAQREEEGASAPTILDLGTGNGHLLFEMLESSADLEDIIDADKMVGVDYSDASIQLAKAVGEKRGGDCTSVKFLSADLLDSAEVERLRQMPKTELGSDGEGWDLVCDKGTMDAIALSSQPIDGKTPVQLYTQAVQKLVKLGRDGKAGGIFLITSCNFTEQELVDRFTYAGFEVDTIIPTPTFTFGGAKGSSTTSIAFRRRA